LLGIKEVGLVELSVAETVRDWAADQTITAGLAFASQAVFPTAAKTI